MELLVKCNDKSGSLITIRVSLKLAILINNNARGQHIASITSEVVGWGGYRLHNHRWLVLVNHLDLWVVRLRNLLYNLLLNNGLHMGVWVTCLLGVNRLGGHLLLHILGSVNILLSYTCGSRHSHSLGLSLRYSVGGLNQGLLGNGLVGGVVDCVWGDHLSGGWDSSYGYAVGCRIRIPILVVLLFLVTRIEVLFQILTTIFDAHISTPGLFQKTLLELFVPVLVGWAHNFLVSVVNEALAVIVEGVASAAVRLETL